MKAHTFNLMHTLAKQKAQKSINADRGLRFFQSYLIHNTKVSTITVSGCDFCNVHKSFYSCFWESPAWPMFFCSSECATGYALGSGRIIYLELRAEHLHFWFNRDHEFNVDRK